MSARVDKTVRRRAKSKCILINEETENGSRQFKSKVAIGLRSILIFVTASLITAIFLECVPHAKVFPCWWSVRNHEQHATPTFALYLKGSREIHLENVVKVLNKLGYQRVGINDSWNLLWSHDYPFLKLPLQELGKPQVVNHFPGCGYLTNKVDLSTSQLPFQPRAFRLPADRDKFLEYAHDHPDALFVQKNNRHRQIKIKEIKEIDLQSNDSFVQEFIQRPFLVDNHKFDIGVYVVITSVNPLRVYIYTGDIRFRFCPIEYHPFDAENVGKYVVAGDFLNPWKIAALEKYHAVYGGNSRMSFEAYVRDQGRDPFKIWPQVEEIIRKTVLAKEKDIVNALHSFSTHNFFELMRFDLFIDEDLKVYLMEANMSPNLYGNQINHLFEQVLYSAFNLVGIRSISATAGIMYGENNTLLTIDQNLATGLNQCAEHNCDQSCEKDECDLCLMCLNELEKETLQNAYQEHLHRVSMKRIVPKPIVDSYPI
ncbi:probable tubulin polyglutamylase ttll-15 [Drosophila takahashii]|uniref:probable tubulin polyglutamylase ttll-15 n=1 Tax=Drosophila takahashii TaxID=29030 RepID=UPI001CF911FF|nr:probable tubulin polyglutamylase ttll-15 [Drosophila takahashii]